MVVCSTVSSIRLSHETIEIQLALEGSHFTLFEVAWHELIHKDGRLMDRERSSMNCPRNDMIGSFEHGSRQHLMQLYREGARHSSSRPLSFGWRSSHGCFDFGGSHQVEITILFGDHTAGARIFCREIPRRVGTRRLLSIAIVVVVVVFLILGAIIGAVILIQVEITAADTFGIRAALIGGSTTLATAGTRREGDDFFGRGHHCC
mmetsp:Transcript_12245/g.27000  ORF Transcript_12245/g.27000 Transcript_12245/m.27000 type:complete len:205 (-) Transcript_12245:48-662(-)